MNRKKILNILFWIALIVVVVLILWRIFGNSPSDLSIIIGIGFMIMFKMWTISDDFNGFKHEVRMSFVKVKSDISDIGKKVEKIEWRKNKK